MVKTIRVRLMKAEPAGDFSSDRHSISTAKMWWGGASTRFPPEVKVAIHILPVTSYSPQNSRLIVATARKPKAMFTNMGGAARRAGCLPIGLHNPDIRAAYCEKCFVAILCTSGCKNTLHSYLGINETSAAAWLVLVHWFAQPGYSGCLLREVL
ncbi:hypothetical protein J6590_027185 [Homalodisca vitripennis]|nr:hypothetical protein J6590_027185 [Homalodisca vitripennis]